MSKIVPSGIVGIPVPADGVAADATKFVVYWGAPGFDPDYAQPARAEFPFSEIPTRDVEGTNYFVFDTSKLPGLAEGDYELRFTIEDDVGNEGDFSPAVAIPLDREAPGALGQPVLLPS